MKAKGKLVRFVSVLVSILFFTQSIPLYAASMGDYCVIPPYVKKEVKPNILILMDNSQIMGNQAYTDSYDPIKAYSGYFQNLWYSYSGGQWVPDPNGAFPGRLMNWALTSSYDLLQSILVGGKSRSRQTNVNTLVGMSNSWTKTYNGCVFKVNSGNLTLTETSDGACSLLNSPPERLAYNETVTPVALAPPKSFKLFVSGLSSRMSKTADRITEVIADYLIPKAYAAKPLRIITNNLSDAPQNQGYSVTVCAEGGSYSGYTWQIESTTIPDPANWTIVSSGTTCTTFSNINVTTATGNYSVTFKVTDSNGKTATKTLTLKVTPPLFRSQNYNIWVCVGNYTVNCNAGTPVKEGIVDMFWSKGRFGLEDFNQTESTITPNYPAGGSCIPASPKETFLTNIENATPVGDASLITPLVNGMYTAINYYKNDTSANCNPFAGSEPCLKNFILMITAGEGADNPPNPNAWTPNVFSDETHCSSSSTPPATYNLSKNACYGYKNDLRAALAGRQYVSTYIVNAMGVNNILAEAATASGGIYYPVTDPAQLRERLMQAFQDIIKRAAAGTAASVLASGEGSGANLIQAVFYPRRKFFNSATNTYDEIAWIGRLTNFWYYVDPYFQDSSILEDTTADKILDISNDNKVKLRFDIPTETTVADLYDSSDTFVDAVDFEYVKSLWEAGVELWNRDITSYPRKIYTTTGNDGNADGHPDLINFSTGNASALRPYLQANDDIESARIINYIRGYDKFCAGTSTACNIDSDCTGVSCESPYRSRAASVDLNGDGDTLDTVTINGKNMSEAPSKVWKLGDVLNSTPKVASWIQLNTFYDKYRDTSYKAFLDSEGYANRGMVFTGANDGMLHAFKLGKLELSGSWKTSDSKKAYLSGTDLGKEMWAFIPKNALPYLKYLTDSGYCHVYTVDLTPYIFDASIGGNPDDTKSANSWKTILIGGMRFGGACRGTNASCTDVSGDGSKDCVNTPVDVDGNSVGFSSYYALDITDYLANQDDPVNHPPVLLWEFSHENLGFASTGPAVVRIGADKSKNGKWFVVFGSGPTGPISTSDQQFMGRSDQNLKLFVLDLETGSLGKLIDTGIQYAFAGSILNSTIDTDLNYQDDVIYIPYVKRAGDNTWTQGGVLRLLTEESGTLDDWSASIVIDNIGPVTSSVVNLQNKTNGKLWLFFGTGRYYFEQLTTVDDGTNTRHLYGIKEPCFDIYGFKASCPDLGDLDNVTTPPDPSAPETDNDGWFIVLDGAGDYSYPEGNPAVTVTRAYRTERVITDPLATTSGLVFFTTYKPYDDACALGGKSFIWAVKYNTGGAPGALLKGVALLQVSTGSIEQVNLSGAFTSTEEKYMGRRSTALEGVPPTAQGLSLLSTPSPKRRVLHIRER